MVKVFVTGATGYIGSRLVTALITEGHAVKALSRRAGTELDKLNVEVVHGSLEDLSIIEKAASQAEAVFHLGFDHNSDYEASCKQDLRVVRAIVKALAGTDKLFVNTSVADVAGDTGNALGKELQRDMQTPRAESELATIMVSNNLKHVHIFGAEDMRAPGTQTLCARTQANANGVRSIALRLPLFVYPNDPGGFYDILYKKAEEVGYSSYVNEGK